MFLSETRSPCFLRFKAYQKYALDRITVPVEVAADELLLEVHLFALFGRCFHDVLKYFRVVRVF